MDIFQDFLKHYLEVFINDFAVFNRLAEHLKYIRRTIQRCQETNLKFHPVKCFFEMISRLLRGHIVSQKGIVFNVGNMLAILATKKRRKLRGFLGCVGFYRKFIEIMFG